MAKDNSIILKDWQNGAAISPHLGFGYMAYTDIFSIPGIVKANYRVSITSSTTVTDLVKWIVQDPVTTTSYYALDKSGDFYASTNSGSTWTKITGNTKTGANGEGLIVWKKFAFIARSGKLDLLDLSASPLSTGWTNGWQNLTATNGFAPMVVGQDDILYIGNGSTVASVQYTGTTFVPGSATFNASAVALPTQYSIKCMGELGQKLMIGTTAVGGAATQKLADIFPWDRRSATFDLPIRMFDFGIHQMMTVDNLLYFVAGQEHTVYVTDGSRNQEVRKLGYNITNVSTLAPITLNPYPGALIKHRNRVMTGVSGLSGSTSNAGIWSLKDNGAVNDYALSGGNTSGATMVEVGALCSTGPQTYMAGMHNGTTFAIYAVDTTAKDSPTIHSAVYVVGTVHAPFVAQNFNLLFNQKLDSGSTVTLYYRYTTGDSWTQVGSTSVNSTTYGLVDSVIVPAGITSASTLQVRIDFTDSNNTGFGIREVQLL